MDQDTRLPASGHQRRRLVTAGIALPALMAAGTAFGQASAWPSRPIRLVLPSGPGGGADLFGRNLAEFMSRQLNVPVVVENRPGANGFVALDTVVRQPPDGYTLVISYSGAMLGNKAMNMKMSHDPTVDLKPIARIGGEGGNLLVVNPGIPVTNLKELVAYAKTQGGKLSYASWGLGSGGHLVMEAIKIKTGMEINHVPYKTVASIPPDIVSGVVTVATIDAATPVPLIKAGRLRAIAALAPSRLPQVPDVPTLTEQGVPYDVGIWYGLLGPLGMPADIVERLNALVNRWLMLPETKAFYEQKQNLPAPVPASPEEFAATIRREYPIWVKLVKDANAEL